MLSVIGYCSQAFPPETVHFGVFVTHAIIACVEKIGIFVSQLEPNRSEQFYINLEKAKW